jgi:hypothetical protein
MGPPFRAVLRHGREGGSRFPPTRENSKTHPKCQEATAGRPDISGSTSPNPQLNKAAVPSTPIKFLGPSKCCPLSPSGERERVRGWAWKPIRPEEVLPLSYTRRGLPLQSRSKNLLRPKLSPLPGSGPRFAKRTSPLGKLTRGGLGKPLGQGEDDRWSNIVFIAATQKPLPSPFCFALFPLFHYVIHGYSTNLYADSSRRG